MYDFPCFNECELMRQASQSFIRVLHASPGTRGVDVYTNGNLIARNLLYRNFTPYLNVPAGEYNIRIYPTGTSDNAIINTNVNLTAGSINTIALIGTQPNIELFVVNEPRIPPLPDRARIRFAHLSTGTPSVDVTLSNGRVVFPNVSYKGITRYTRATPGRYTIQLKTAGTNNTILSVPNIRLDAAKNYTFYFVGIAGGTPGLQLLIPLDGNTYL